MKHKDTIYLDTSVPSAYYDERMPDRARLTKLFWDKLVSCDVCLSEITINELEQTLDPNLKNKLLNLVRSFKTFLRTPESDDLAAKYIEERIIPKNYAPDAYHLAIASTNNIGYLISWNFDHLVNVRTRHKGVCLMDYFFDTEKAAKESGLNEETIKQIKNKARQEFPNDDMMYELHVLRAIESIKHPLPIKEKTLAGK